MNFGYVGMTRSGKTTLATMIVAGRYAAGRQVAVLDRMKDPRWKCHKRFTDPREFLAFAMRSVGWELVADEWGVTVPRGEDDRAFDWLGTTARHHGHAVHVICHRWTQLRPALRDGLDNVFCFAQGKGSAALLAEEFARPELMEVVRFPRLQFILAARCADTRPGTIEFRRRRPRVVWQPVKKAA